MLGATVCVRSTYLARARASSYTFQSPGADAGPDAGAGRAAAAMGTVRMNARAATPGKTFVRETRKKVLSMAGSPFLLRQNRAVSSPCPVRDKFGLSRPSSPARFRRHAALYYTPRPPGAP